MLQVGRWETGRWRWEVGESTPCPPHHISILAGMVVFRWVFGIAFNYKEALQDINIE
jgi:hypothetical protein